MRFDSAMNLRLRRRRRRLMVPFDMLKELQKLRRSSVAFRRSPTGCIRRNLKVNNPLLELGLSLARSFVELLRTICSAPATITGGHFSLSPTRLKRDLSAFQSAPPRSAPTQKKASGLAAE
jgi:hypothetical protein